MHTGLLPFESQSCLLQLSWLKKQEQKLDIEDVNFWVGEEGKRVKVKKIEAPQFQTER